MVKRKSKPVRKTAGKPTVRTGVYPLHRDLQVTDAEEVGEGAAEPRADPRPEVGRQGRGRQVGHGVGPGRHLHADRRRRQVDAGAGDPHQHVQEREQGHGEGVLLRQGREGPAEDDEEVEGRGERQHRLAAELIDEGPPDPQEEDVGDLAQHAQPHDPRLAHVEPGQHVDGEEGHRQLGDEVPQEEEVDQLPEVPVPQRRPQAGEDRGAVALGGGHERLRHARHEPDGAEPQDDAAEEHGVGIGEDLAARGRGLPPVDVEGRGEGRHRGGDRRHPQATGEEPAHQLLGHEVAEPAVPARVHEGVCPPLGGR